jgi:hypothetical protein
LTSSFSSGGRKGSTFLRSSHYHQGGWGVLFFSPDSACSRRVGSSHSSSDLIIRSPGASAYNDPPPSLTRGVIYFLSGMIMTRATEESFELTNEKRTCQNYSFLLKKMVRDPFFCVRKFNYIFLEQKFPEDGPTWSGSGCSSSIRSRRK